MTVPQERTSLFAAEGSMREVCDPSRGGVGVVRAGIPASAAPFGDRLGNRRLASAGRAPSFSAVGLKDARVSSPDQARGTGQTTGQRFRWVSPSSWLRISAASRPGECGVIAARSAAESRVTPGHLSLAGGFS